MIAFLFGFIAGMVTILVIAALATVILPPRKARR